MSKNWLDENKAIEAGSNSCLNCALYSKCTNKSKSFSYICLKHKPKIMLDLNTFEREQEEIQPFSFDPTREEEFNIFDFIDEVVDANEKNPLHTDVKIDTTGIPQAPNFFTFCFDPRFLNIKPYPKQLEVMSEYYNEVCWHCSNKDWKHNFPYRASLDDIKDNITFMEFGVCPKCKRKKSRRIQKGIEQQYKQFVGLIGQRSGKSYISVAASAYSTHWALKQPALPLLFGLAPHSQFHSMFVAMTYKQIRDSVYDSLYSLYTNAPWFVAMHDCLDYYGRKYGEPLYAVKDTYFRYRTCNLTGFITTPDYRTLRGKTSFGVSVFDEVGLMSASNENSIKNNVDQVHKSILNSYRTANSALTRLYNDGNNNIINNSFMNISSPYSKNDKIMRLYEQSRKIKSMYGVRYKSFEFNPDFDYSSFEDERLANYSDYLRDIECIPPMSSNPYIDDIKHLSQCLGSFANAVKITPVQFETKTGKNMSRGDVSFRWTDKNVNKILGLDAGRNNNSFALALGHLSDDNIPIYDTLVELIPIKGCPINFTRLTKDIIYRIIEEFNVKMVVADRWNSAKLLDDIEDKYGIKVETYSVKYSDFSSFKEAILNEQVTFPKCEVGLDTIEADTENYPYVFLKKPVSHFALQLITVQDYGDKQVEKGDGYTDDIFRAAVLIYSYLTDNDYKDKFKGVTLKGRQGGLIAIGGNSKGGVVNSNIGARPMGSLTNSNVGARPR